MNDNEMVEEDPKPTYDVEGHRKGLDGTDEDVEGHRKGLDGTDEDVEGHRRHD